MLRRSMLTRSSLGKEANAHFYVINLQLILYKSNNQLFIL
jgi:hypothetical protein